MMPDMLASSLWIAAPELILSIGAMILLMIGVFMGEKSSQTVTGLSVAVIIIAALWLILITPLGVGFGGSFVPGDNLTINLMSQVFISPNTAVDFFAVDLFYYENGPWGGIELHFDALLGGSVVATDGFTIANGGGRDNITSTTLSISGVSFDELRLYATLSDGTFTAMTGVIDNVTITPAPAGVALLGLGGLTLVRRRR